MAQSLSNVLIHLVYGTLDRRHTIPANLLPEVHAYLATVCTDYGCRAVKVGGTTNHVHMLIDLGRTRTVAQTAEEVKKRSSKWVKTKGRFLDKFAWQHGYAAFSVCTFHRQHLVDYIENQAEHHRRRTFEEEYIAFLDKHCVEYDPNYLWST